MHLDEMPDMVQVAIVDSNRVRRETLGARFSELPHVEATTFGGWDDFENHSTHQKVQWQLVVLDYLLPGKRPFEDVARLKYRVEKLIQDEVVTPTGRVLILKYQSDIPLDPRLNPEDQKRVDIWDLDAAPELRLDNHVKNGLPLPSKPDEVSIPKDIVLRQQLSLLDSECRGEVLETRLGYFATRYMPNCRRVEIVRLTQGFSGALVIRAVLTPRDPGGLKYDMVLKVSPTSDFWKVQRVIEHWPLIEKAFKGELEHSVPTFVQTASGSPIVSHRQLHVEAWRYLGGDLGKFKEFGEIYCTPVTDDPPPGDVLRATFRMLNAAWHSDAAGFRDSSLWDKHDATYPDKPASPPYQLTAWWKAQILGALHELERVAPRLESKNSPLERMSWKNDRKLIEEWILKGPRPGSIASKKRRVITSPVHGDLNHHNLLWSHALNRPFLIDFATFHPEGHLVQDFAMIESQLHLALMDCEESSANPELDWSSSQFEEWMKRLPDLVPESEPLAAFKPLDSTEPKLQGIRFAEGLIMLVREEAARIYLKASQKLGGVSGFDDEYCTALLFETLRMVAFRMSLSPFKRILAAQSSARLIRRLNHPAGK